MSENILEIKNLSKSFGVVKALKNISISIRKGEIHALCGENGAGKSTLVKVLDGYYPYGTYEGEVYLDGRLCRFNSPGDSIQNGIAMIYQEINILKFLTIADNIFVGEFPNKNGVVNKKELYKKTQEIMNMVDLKGSPAGIAGELNASRQQLLMIAKALVKNPKILILDEPTSALTYNETKKLMEILNRLRDNGVTCIYISHKLDEIGSIADRLTVIRDGESIVTLEKDEFEINRIISAMVGRSIENMYPKRNVEPGEEVLKVEHLDIPHPKIKGRYLLKDISFSLKKGEILGFAGLVGAGRSELINTIYGHMKKEKGEITIFGKKARIKSPVDALKNKMVLLTEERKSTGLFMEMLIKENITAASINKISRGMLLSKKKEDLESQKYFDMLKVKAPSINTSISNLSGGNQQKVVFAKALMTEPKILFLDEPTRGIDVGAKNEIYQIMNELAEKGYSIIMISSELPELLNMCDRFVVISNGSITAELTKEEASEERIMLSATGTADRNSGKI